ncbi:MAG TPA: polysaccharide biosynthesis/export family protein [Myxococcota bacterium]|nr:polysaccharide biosynthesis/export family protein [Myxococcota bacterium]
MTVLLMLLFWACAKAPPNVAEAGSELRTPAPQDFVFGPGDIIDVKVWRHDDLDMTITIAPDGNISYPLVGSVQVSGLTYPELVATLETTLSEYLVDPSVAVNIVEVSNQKVFVLGEVQNPAVLQIQNELSILEALVRTGGIHPDARTSNVMLIRGDFDSPELFLIDVDAIYGQGDLSQMVLLQKGDIVYVPAKTIVNVERFFRRIQGILAPFVAGSAIYRNAISGGAQGTSSVLE